MKFRAEQTNPLSAVAQGNVYVAYRPDVGPQSHLYAIATPSRTLLPFLETDDFPAAVFLQALVLRDIACGWG